MSYKLNSHTNLFGLRHRSIPQAQNPRKAENISCLVSEASNLPNHVHEGDYLLHSDQTLSIGLAASRLHRHMIKPRGLVSGLKSLRISSIPVAHSLNSLFFKPDPLPQSPGGADTDSGFRKSSHVSSSEASLLFRDRGVDRRGSVESSLI